MNDLALDNPVDTGSSDSGSIVDAPNNITDTPAAANAAPQTWHDNWRNDMAGGDEKFMKQLDRFGSPTDVFKSYREVQSKLSSQPAALEKPGEDSTPEQVSAYRESIGVPETFEGYNLDSADGTVIGEDIKPQLDGYLKHAHDNNVSQDQVKQTVDWFLADVEAQAQSLKTANDEARIDGTAELRSEWGGEFQGNMNAVHSLFTEAPEGTMEGLLNSSGDDGLKFANNADNIRWLVGLAKQLNPTATLVPPGPDQAGSIDTEIDKIQSMMNSADKVERNKYWQDDKMQARFAQLNQAKQER